MRKPPPAVPEGAGVPSTVEGRVDKIDIFLVHAILRKAQSLAEALEMHDLPGAQELDDVVDVRVVAEPQDVVVGDAGLLLRRQVLGQIGDQVALDRHGRRVPREAGGCGGIDTGGVIHKVGVEAGGLDVLLRQIAGQLVDDGADHLQMPQLLRAQRSIGNVPQRKFSSKSCVSWALGT